LCVPLRKLRSAIPSALPKNPHQPCQHGTRGRGALVELKLRDGRTLTYGPCKWPASINRVRLALLQASRSPRYGFFPPKIVSGHSLRGTFDPYHVRRGTPVSPSFSGERVFANRRVGFAIADLRQAGDATYPLVTFDGGRMWRVDGPVFHINAAQGPVAVDQAGVRDPRTFFAWCGECGTVIDVTSDAGRHWWQVFMPGAVLSVTGGPLTAVVKGPLGAPGAAEPWLYQSRTGRRWRFRYSIQGF